MKIENKKLARSIKRVTSTKPFRNPFVGKTNQRWYCISAADMRVLRKAVEEKNNG